ncbi:MAG: helix-turn-helix transcriptional regulator [Polyangiaceae bacterium]
MVVLRTTLRECRRTEKLTQAQLAKLVGCSRQTIVALERGETPSLRLALTIEDALNQARYKRQWPELAPREHRFYQVGRVGSLWWLANLKKSSG